ncbi:MAG TPA: nucleoside transporter C-terminal domain-containing protein [Acidobacteriaceae bacterium]|nr:nucleoside transporter C-terminal domain-containing protein [Acidobacteriaceae bacterium]
MGRWTGILGLLCMLCIAYLFSDNRRAIRWRTVAWGLCLQVVFAFLVLRWSVGQAILNAAGNGVNRLLGYSFAGSRMVFGDLGRHQSPEGMIFAFQTLPTIIFISAFFALLYYIGVMQMLIRFFARLMQMTMRLSGAESLNVAASVFMGQTEAPLTIRPFLPDATNSELMTIMTSGMAHVSGGIMAAYILYGISAQHLLAAVIMTAPGTILVSKMLVPETQYPATAGHVHMPPDEEHKGENLLGAIARGTMDGGRLAFNVGIMLISFLALVAMVNGVFGGLHNWLGLHHIPFPTSLNAVLGFLFAPVAWLIGIPWHSAALVGNLLGTRMVINELVAYSMLGTQKAVLDPRSFTIATFALCGFANISSIGIQIGGIGALAPNRRNDLARLGLRALLAGTMANLMSAAIVGILM